MKKIVIIVHGLSGGGAERVAAHLANYLAGKGNKVLYICAYSTVEEDSHDGYHLDDSVSVRYIPVKSKSGMVRFLKRNIRIMRAARAFSPDYVLSLISYEAVLTAMSGLPLIYSLRNNPETCMSQGFRSKLIEIMFAKSRKIVFQSQGAQNYFRDRYLEKSVVIPNPIRTEDLPLWTEHKHEKKIVTACRLNAQKNLPMLVQAFSGVHRKYPEYTLEIYGKGELQSALQEQIRSLNAEDYILLKGFTPDIHTIMAEASGFVLSSDYEGLSNSMLEALCIGVPCVCTDCPPGSAREFITSGENGFLSRVGDAQDMEEKICALIENEELAMQFAKKNLAIRKRLDVENVCAEWEKLLR